METKIYTEVELEISKPITREVKVSFSSNHPKEVIVEWIKSMHKSSTFDEYYDEYYDDLLLNEDADDVDEGDVWEIRNLHIDKTPEIPQSFHYELIFDEKIQKWIDEKVG